MFTKKKLQEKTAVLGVVGLGYVGLPLAVEKAKAGYKTIGFDVNEDLQEIIDSGHLEATTDFSKVASADCVCICVPTPLDKYQQPDISYVTTSAESIVQYMHKDMLIILESTTYPGTTEELLKPILEKSGLVCGKDFYLAFSPERVDPGNLVYKTKNTPKVVGGITPDCTDVAATLYESILEAPIHRVSSPAIAEMEKILENTYRNVNIGLVNELSMLCNRMGINFGEVADAAKTKPYGFQVFYPGPGLGGHCIPLDPYYLSWKAREYGFHTSMIESSMMINDRMPEYCTERIGKILNRYNKSISDSNILILGVAYKKDIDDYRESPALEVINILEKQNANISYFDPYICEFKFKGVTKVGEKSLTADLLANADLVVITTSHTNFDYDFIQKHSKYIFDTRNAMENVNQRTNIELL